VDAITVTYADMFKLMSDLRAMAETNAVLERRKSFSRRTTFLRAAEIYARRFAAAEGRLALLRAAGWARFEERAAALAAEMCRATAAGVAGWRPEDGALCAALAEGLAYGRDRAALRLCGERLARGEPPDALLTTAARLPVIERRRLDGLLALLGRWGWASPLATLIAALEAGAQRAGASGAALALTEALHVAERGAVSPGRARILAFNMALPAIVAWARLQPDDPARVVLERLARAAVDALPGLPSNQITREMTRQLGLPRLPGGALAQQGLHHLWSRACREKRCDLCPCASAKDGSDSPLLWERGRG